MSLTLDAVLFWVGLLMVAVGLFVFLTGKATPPDKQKGSNRFEAFGIKIDVSNPSLLLVILGVVLMLVPRFVPQGDLESVALLPEGLREPVVELPEPEVEPSVDRGGDKSAAEESVAPAEPPQAEPVSQPEPKPDPGVWRAPAPTEVKPEPEPVTPAVRPVPEKPTATIQAEPARAVTQTAVADPPVVQKAEPPPSVLVVIAQADVSTEAGIRDETVESYSARVAGELQNQAEMIVGGAALVRNESIDDLRALLDLGNAQYAELCQRFEADYLLLGDLEVPFDFGGVASAYWPDLTLHLCVCDGVRCRREKKTHLNPSRHDAFIFQQAISDQVVRFLGIWRSLLP